MQKKPDRRTRRTKAQLRHGLAQLMAEKSVNEVTVKELVDMVDINRSTFYLPIVKFVPRYWGRTAILLFCIVLRKCFPITV